MLLDDGIAIFQLDAMDVGLHHLHVVHVHGPEAAGGLMAGKDELYLHQLRGVHLLRPKQQVVGFKGFRVGVFGSASKRQRPHAKR
eukprot:7767557-Pyramimonas_sp.AAC.2